MTKSQGIFGRKRHEFSFVIANPDPTVAYDDLLGPDLIQLPVFPVHEGERPEGRLLVVETSEESVTADNILEVFRKHGIEAKHLELPGQ